MDMNTGYIRRNNQDHVVGWLEPTIDLPSHAAMGTEATDVAERICRTTTAHPNTCLAFDADGYLVDWQDIDSDTWANDTTPQQRIHVFAGGANRAFIAKSLSTNGPGESSDGHT